MANARRPPDEGRIGSVLAVIGCLGLLGITFGAGFYSGRLLTRPGSAPAAAMPASGGPALRGASALATAAAPPTLTFYEELTAPLPLPALPGPKVAVAPPRRVPEKPEPAPLARPEDRSARSEKRGSDGAARLAGTQGAGPRFTVQIAAYSARASAEALRSTISAAGHEAYIVENDAPAGAPRFRVRVGSYPTREAAIAAAARLPGAGARYVTSR